MDNTAREPLISSLAARQAFYFLASGYPWGARLRKIAMVKDRSQGTSAVMDISKMLAIIRPVVN
jgi:hypothetical protein